MNAGYDHKTSGDAVSKPVADVVDRLMKRHLCICRRFGEILVATAGRRAAHPTVVGIAATSSLERSWNYCQLYAGAVDRTEFVEQVAEILWDMARQSAPQPARQPAFRT